MNNSNPKLDESKTLQKGPRNKLSSAYLEAEFITFWMIDSDRAMHEL